MNAERIPLCAGSDLVDGGRAWAFDVCYRGQTLRAFAQAMTTPAGALGLVGQVGFAVLPALRR